MTGKKLEGKIMIKRFYPNNQVAMKIGKRIKSLILFTAILAVSAVNPVNKNAVLSAQALPVSQSSPEAEVTDRFRESAEWMPTFAPADIIPASASADDHYWDQLFQTPGTSGTVYAMHQAGDKIYITGDFRTAGGSNVNNVAYWDERREVWLPVGKGIPDFKGYTIAYRSENEIWVGGEPGSGNGARIYLWDGNEWMPQKMESGVIHALYFWQNDLYAGGEFDFMADGIRFKSIARLENGSWSPLGEGIRRETDMAGVVYAMSMDLDGDLLIGGSFSYANERKMLNLARWDGQEFYDYNGGAHLAGVGEGAVHTIELSKDGKPHLYIGGLFDNVGYPEVSVSNIAMWDGKEWSGLNGGVDNTVRVIRSNDEAMYAGGDFDQVSGFGAAKRLAIWSGTSWNWLPGGISNLNNDTVYDMLVGTGKEPRFYVAGKFERTGDVTHISHRRVDNIARFDGGWHALGKGFRSDEQIHSIDIDQWGNAYVGGDFHYAGGIPSRNVAMWSGAGWQNLGMGVNNEVKAVRVHGNQVYVGGRFLSAKDQNGLEMPVSRIARWSNNNWEQLESGDIYVFGCEGVNDGEVRAIDIDQATGTILVGGSFLQAGCKPASRVATWNGVWNQLGDGLPGPVSVILHASDKIYAGGMFVGTEKQKFNNVAWITGPDSFWRPVGGFEIGETTPGVSDGDYGAFVSALSIDCRGDLWIGGNFRKAGDNSNYSNIATFNNENGWGKPGMFNYAVYALKSKECSMFAGGNFYTETTKDTPLYLLARWNLIEWLPLGDGLLGPTAGVNAIAINNYRLFAGGYFEKNGEIRSFKFAGWDMKGIPDDKFITFEGAIDTTSFFEYGQFIDIQWSSAINDITVKLDYSINNGQTWNNIAEGLPASGNYIWFVPDVDIQTAAFRVSDMSAPEYIHDTRTDRRIAGTASREIYVLKRPVEGSSEKEPFRVDRHGWNFGNTGNNIWPEEYWSIFDYPKLSLSTAARNLSDTQKLYLLFDTPRGEWVDIWSWCDPKQTCLANGAFGNPQYIKQSAFTIWVGQAILNEGFAGSCYGFSLSTLLFFDRFYNISGHFPDSANLNDAALSNKARRFINTHQIAQFRKHAFISNAYRLATDKPSDTIERLKESLQRDRDHEVITMMLTVTRGHSMVPYRMVKAPDSNIWTIYVYDPNLPGNFNTYIEVNTDTEEWVFSGTLNKNKLKKDQSPEDVPFEPWSGNGWGLIASSPIGDLQVAGRIGSHAHFNFKREGSADEIQDAAVQMIAHSSEMQITEMQITEMELTGQEPDPDDFIELHVAPVFDILVRNQGGVLGFSNDEIATTGGIGYPVLSITPDTYNERPFAYALLSGASEYTVEMTNNSAGIKNLVWMDGGLSYIYDREGVDSEDMDVIRISDTVDFSNPGMSAKTFNFGIEYEGSNDTLKYIGLSRLRLDGYTSMNVEFKNRNGIIITNRSGDQVAGLELLDVNPGNEYSDRFPDVPLRGYATHWIEPQWHTPGSPLKLHIDTNNDGNWDETILLNPELPEGTIPLLTIPHDDVSAAGYPIKIQIMVGSQDNEVEDLFGSGFQLQFDPLLVEYTGLVNGDFLAGGTENDWLSFNEAGESHIAYSITRTSGPGLDGSGQLVEFEFLARPGSAGSTALFILSDILANNSQGSLIPLQATGTGVRIVQSEVWPGDTDINGTVTAADVLPIIQFYGKTGPVRREIFNFVWEAQPAEPWLPVMATFADANGNGAVGFDDVEVVMRHFGNTSIPGNDDPLSPMPPVLNFSLEPGNAGTRYRLRLETASEENPLSGFRGISAHLHYPDDLVRVDEILPGAMFEHEDLVTFVAETDAGGITGFAYGLPAGADAITGYGTAVEMVLILRENLTDSVGITLSDIHMLTGYSIGNAGVNLIKITSTSAEDGGIRHLPAAYSLSQNYPNPFNPATNIRYELPVDSPVRLEVFDLLGRRVALLYDGLQTAGRHAAAFDASRLASGVYIYRIQTPEFTQTRKMMLVK